MTVRLKDIANEAGVSISTVSRVLNDPSTTAARQELQEKIWEIVRRTGYSPNRQAQLLKNGSKEHELTVKKPVYCLIACSAEEVKDDTFYTQILSAIEREAYNNNYALAYTFFARDLEDPATVRQFQEHPKDNLIVIGRFKPAIMKILSKGFKRIVYTGLNELDINCDQVLCDGYTGIMEAVQYFYDLGHRRIGLIGNQANREARCRGYFNQMKELGLAADPCNLASDTTLSLEGGQQGMQQLIRQNFDATAIICANDMVAMGVLAACKKQGIRVPEDLSVMGMNDMETVQYISPMLTTVHVPMDEMGKVAMRVLIDRAEGGHSLPQKVFLPFYIAKRESTAGIPVKKRLENIE